MALPKWATHTDSPVLAELEHVARTYDTPQLDLPPQLTLFPGRVHRPVHHHVVELGTLLLTVFQVGIFADRLLLDGMIDHPAIGMAHTLNLLGVEARPRKAVNDVLRFLKYQPLAHETHRLLRETADIHRTSALDKDVTLA